MSDHVAMEVSRRLTEWVHRNFPEDSGERALSELRDLPAAIMGGQDPERVLDEVLGGARDPA